MPQRRKSTSKGNVIRGPVAILFLVVVFAIYLFQQYQEGGLDLPADNSGGVVPLPLTEQVNVPAGKDAITVTFSDPLAGKTSGGPEEALVQAINAAQETVDVAIYNISLDNVTDALLAAFNRGVRVRMVMESDSLDGDSAQRLIDGGVEILGDQREGLMHNKFVIIDSREVWMGSMNFTSTSAYKDFNNLVRLRSQRVVQDYAAEFEELFTDGLFGPAGEANTPYPLVTIDGIQVEIYFSPDDGVAEQIVAEIEQAKTMVVFMAYSFTSDPIADAMRARAAQGVEIRGVFDESQYKSNKGGEFDSFVSEGFDVRLDGISGLLHSKVIIIDGKTVITGSYNFSASAENSNDENIIIIHDVGIAKMYLQNFEQVYTSAQ